jgi:hypothetical protein
MPQFRPLATWFLLHKPMFDLWAAVECDAQSGTWAGFSASASVIIPPILHTHVSQSAPSGPSEDKVTKDSVPPNYDHSPHISA